MWPNHLIIKCFFCLEHCFVIYVFHHKQGVKILMIKVKDKAWASCLLWIRDQEWSTKATMMVVPILIQLSLRQSNNCFKHIKSKIEFKFDDWLMNERRIHREPFAIPQSLRHPRGCWIIWFIHSWTSYSSTSTTQTIDDCSRITTRWTNRREGMWHQWLYDMPPNKVQRWKIPNGGDEVDCQN